MFMSDFSNVVDTQQSDKEIELIYGLRGGGLDETHTPTSPNL